VHIQCSRSGKVRRERLKVLDESLRRQRQSKKCECPFSVHASMVRGEVTFRIGSLGHNHDPEVCGQAVLVNTSMLNSTDVRHLDDLHRIHRGNHKMLTDLATQYLQEKLAVPVNVSSE
jgi:hypothetical protein